MRLLPDQTVAEAPRPLQAFRYMSFDVIGARIDFESATKDGHAAIAAEARIEIDDFMIEASQGLSRLCLRSNELKESRSHNRRIGNAYMTASFPINRWIATTRRSKTQSAAE